jgi:transcriptional regulator with XRE-family HTH domain
VDKPRAEIAGERRLAERTEKADAQLRERRLARNLTQKALARELGVIANTVARWERCEVPIPHWVAPHLAMQQKIAELTSALAAGKKTQKELRRTIEAKNFELQVEKAMKRGPTADQFYRRLCKAFSVAQHPTTLQTINEIYLNLTKPSKIDGELYSVDNELRPADGA